MVTPSPGLRAISHRNLPGPFSAIRGCGDRIGTAGSSHGDQHFQLVPRDGMGLHRIPGKANSSNRTVSRLCPSPQHWHDDPEEAGKAGPYSARGIRDCMRGWHTGPPWGTSSAAGSHSSPCETGIEIDADVRLRAPSLLRNAAYHYC